MAPIPYELAATAIKAVIDAEFASEGITAIHDNIHEAMGTDRVAVGIAPMREVNMTGNAVVNEMQIEVRFYDLWDKQIDPAQMVNPIKITTYADRLRRAIQVAQASYSGSPEVWYFQVIGIEYPDDPTGNKTRFHASIRAYGDNTGLVETRV
jgi:hypothetical protein